MKLYKAKFQDKKGKLKEVQHWSLTFTDRNGRRCRMPLSTNKDVAETAKRRINELLTCERGNYSTELRDWLSNTTDKMRQNLNKLGLLDGFRVSKHLGKSLNEHLNDFCEGMTADNHKANYVDQTYNNIFRILDGCGFKRWPDIDGNMVKRFLAKSRGKGGYSERTYNAYLQGFKMFCGWLIAENRVIGLNPMENHSTITQTEFRKKRRALTVDTRDKKTGIVTVGEITRLLEATKAAPKRFNMTGYERTLVYRLALEVGLRANEIRTLKINSFNLEYRFDNKKNLKFEGGLLFVASKNTKNKKPAELILSPKTAAELKEFFAGKDPTASAFNMPHTANTAKMIKADLKDADIEYRDAAGRDVDFHALRSTYITNLLDAGRMPVVVQKLARHASIETTMKYYSGVKRESEITAMQALWTYQNLTDSRPDSAQHKTLQSATGQESPDNTPKTALSA